MINLPLLSRRKIVEAGFELAISILFTVGAVAQLVEQRTGIPKVRVQIPLESTIFRRLSSVPYNVTYKTNYISL